MPKLGKYFNIQITFSARDELREKLIALAYLRGDEGEYAPMARDLMTEAVERFIGDLDPQEKREFKEILKAVETAAILDKMAREQRLKERLQGGPDPDDEYVGDIS